MLTGWQQQQLARNFRAVTIQERENLVHRFVDHAEHSPWDWTVVDADEFLADECAILKPASATIRAYQNHVKRLCDFLTGPE